VGEAGEVGEVDDLLYAGTGDDSGTGDLALVFDLGGGEYSVNYW
jgi:hypothetical protein